MPSAEPVQSAGRSAGDRGPGRGPRPAAHLRRGAAALGVCGLALLLSAVGPAHADDCASFEIVGDRIAEPLGGLRGDAMNGPAVALAPDQGDCTICHRLPLPNRQFHGTVGPALDAVGARLDAGQLRLRIAAPKRLNPNSVMPAYCTTGGRHRVALGFVGRPILDARQIEDLVAWLASLDGAAEQDRDDGHPESGAAAPGAGGADS